MSKVQDAGKCINCVKGGHQRRNCKSRKCISCKKGHHILLHFDKKQSLLGSAVKNPDFHHVFLATVIFQVIDQHGNWIKVGAVLDSGSQVNLTKISGIGANFVEAKRRSMI